MRPPSWRTSSRSARSVSAPASADRRRRRSSSRFACLPQMPPRSLRAASCSTPCTRPACSPWSTSTPGRVRRSTLTFRLTGSRGTSRCAQTASRSASWGSTPSSSALFRPPAARHSRCAPRSRGRARTTCSRPTGSCTWGAPSRRPRREPRRIAPAPAPALSVAATLTRVPPAKLYHLVVGAGRSRSSSRTCTIFLPTTRCPPRQS